MWASYLITITFLFGLLLLVVYVSRRPRKLGKLHDSEVCDGMPIVEKRCGGRFDNLHLSTPLVKLTIFKDRITVRYTDGQIELIYKDITETNIKKGFTSLGLQIVHNKSELPQIIVLWTPYSQSIKELIDEKLKDQINYDQNNE